MKKGFTLLELMAVIMIMALIAAIAIPSITNQIASRKSDVSKVSKNIIYNAAELYMDKHRDDYPKDVGNSYCISLDTLVKENYLSRPLKDYDTGDEIPLTKYVKTTVNTYAEYDDFNLVDSSC